MIGPCGEFHAWLSGEYTVVLVSWLVYIVFRGIKKEAYRNHVQE